MMRWPPTGRWPPRSSEQSHHLRSRRSRTGWPGDGTEPAAATAGSQRAGGSEPPERAARHQCGSVRRRCDEGFAVSYRPWTELLEPLLQCVSGSGRLALRPGHQRELCLIVPLMIAFLRQAPEAGGVRASCPASPDGEGGAVGLSAGVPSSATSGPPG